VVKAKAGIKDNRKSMKEEREYFNILTTLIKGGIERKDEENGRQRLNIEVEMKLHCNYLIPEKQPFPDVTQDNYTGPVVRMRRYITVTC
jgi:hypothetical protein